MKIILFIFFPLFMLGLCFWIIGERGRLLRRSTLDTLRAYGLRRFFNLDALHMYIYARWSAQYERVLRYKIFPWMNERSKKWLRERYHAKIITYELAEAIIKHDHDMINHDLEQIVPYERARNLFLQSPLPIALYECPCRNSSKKPCHPTRVCMIVGQPFVDFLLEHHPKASEPITQKQALDLLYEEHKRGHMHSVWFKDVALDRLFAVCNCCKCCCVGIEAMIKHGNPMMAPSGYVAHVDENKCKKCGSCFRACPFGAISMKNTSFVDSMKCMGCGVCTSQCESGAISLSLDRSKGIPLDVRILNK